MLVIIPCLSVVGTGVNLCVNGVVTECKRDLQRMVWVSGCYRNGYSVSVERYDRCKGWVGFSCSNIYTEDVNL